MEIELNNLSFQYEKVNYKNKVILDNINLKILPGRITSIIGKNGSGKTTLLELINRDLNPTKGEITTLKSIGYVPQTEENIFLYNTVQSEFISILNTTNYKNYQYQKRILDVLIMVDLEERILNKNPKKLSQSETRKLLLAMALIKNPKVLLLDEVSVNLDEVAKKNLIKILRLLKTRYNKTIIIASNDIEFVHKISDYIYVLDNKKIILEGNKYDVFKNVELLKKHHINVPKTILFSDTVYKKKNVKIGYRDEINDLIKDIYRFVR